MPKKRHHSKYNKPLTTAPASLGSSSASKSISADSQSKGVNELLADLRRASLASSNHPSSPSGPSSYSATSGGGASSFSSSSSPSSAPPTLPPALRQILQIPDTPPLPPRRPLRGVDVNGRRPPPGPRAPRSWVVEESVLGNRRNLAGAAASGRGSALECDRVEYHGLPGAYVPDQGSMTDVVLRRMASDWDFQSTYNQHYLWLLHSRARAALISYVGVWGDRGLTAADLRSVLVPSENGDGEGKGEGKGKGEGEGGVLETWASSSSSLLSSSPSSSWRQTRNQCNEDFYFLDLRGCIGSSLSVKEVSDVLFPQQQQQQQQHQQHQGKQQNPSLSSSVQPEEIQDSWDASPPDAPFLPSPFPTILLPNLTHLSLALKPSQAPSASWKQLLAFSRKLPTLTHLSLAYWPAPSLTPNAAKLATVIDVDDNHGPQGQRIQYSGTGPYSHTLDDDWSEAIVLLRKLSKSLYGLEFLDLTGCSAWSSSVLMHDRDGDRIDWGGDWGKVSTLRLRHGFPVGENTPVADVDNLRRAVAAAAAVERYIVGRRAGRGRFITVERDVL